MIWYLIRRYRLAVAVGVAGALLTTTTAVAPSLLPKAEGMIPPIVITHTVVAGPSMHTVTATATVTVVPPAVTVAPTSPVPSSLPTVGPPSSGPAPAPTSSPPPTVGPTGQNPAHGHDGDEMCVIEIDHGRHIQVLCRLLG